MRKCRSPAETLLQTLHKMLSLPCRQRAELGSQGHPCGRGERSTWGDPPRAEGAPSPREHPARHFASNFWGNRLPLPSAPPVVASPSSSVFPQKPDSAHSGQFSRSVVSDSLLSHGLQHASLSITNSLSLLKLMSIEVVMPSSHLILCCPLLLLPPIPPSIRVFSNESTPCMRWPKYWSFSFSISPSNEHPGLISLRMDWLDLLAAQGTLKSLLRHHSSKASSYRSLTQHFLYYSPVHVLSLFTTCSMWNYVGKRGKGVPGWGGRFQAPISLRKGQSPTLLPSMGTFSSPSPSV